MTTSLAERVQVTIDRLLEEAIRWDEKGMSEPEIRQFAHAEREERLALAIWYEQMRGEA